MASNLDPLVSSAWHDYYRAAARRRRRAGGRGRNQPKPRKRINEDRLLALVMGLSAAAVVLSIVLPA